MFDIAKVPFSRCGSYFSVGIKGWGVLGKGLYLSTHYDNSPQVFKLDLMRGEQPVAYEIDATPAALTLKAEGGGQVQFVMDGNETARVRGQGVTLRLEMPKERWTTCYQMPGGPRGAWAVNMSRHQVQIALDVLAGELGVDTEWKQGQGFCWETARFIATLSGDATGGFEAAFDGFLTTWTRPRRAGFDVIRDQVQREYAQWMVNLPAVAKEYEAARDLAAYVNWSAILAPAGHLTRPTMFMSKYSMCNIYGWDHAFNAMAHASHQPQVAWDQLLVMAETQDAFGKFASSMNRNEIRYTISNAPVQGWALKRMWKRNPGLFTPGRMTEAYDFLSRWSEWLCKYRTWPGDVLPYYQHGFDSGWDNATIFDQGVPIVSPDQPAYLILQLEALGDLAEALGRSAEASDWRRRAKAMLDALVKELWQGDQFVGMLRPSGKMVACESLLTCMPMVLGRRLPKQVAQALVARIKDHLTPHGLATEKPDSPHYAEDGYWRGPIWAPSTMLVTTGLEDIGEQELANTIMRGFCEMCRAHGFYENFSPKTGEGFKCPSYTWTSSVFMIFAGRLHELQNAGG